MPIVRGLRWGKKVQSYRLQTAARVDIVSLGFSLYACRSSEHPSVRRQHFPSQTREALSMCPNCSIANDHISSASNPIGKRVFLCVGTNSSCCFKFLCMHEIFQQWNIYTEYIIKMWPFLPVTPSHDRIKYFSNEQSSFGVSVEGSYSAPSRSGFLTASYDYSLFLYFSQLFGTLCSSFLETQKYAPLFVAFRTK